MNSAIHFRVLDDLLKRGKCPCEQDSIGNSGYIYLMGRRTPIPQAMEPRGFYIQQDVLRVEVAFE